MSEGVQITFRGDISDVVKKAEQIPGEVDRAARKARRSWEGMAGQERDKGDAYGKLAGTGREIEKEQEKLRQAELDRYRDAIEWNSKLQADQDKAAQAAIDAEMADYELRLRHNSKLVEDQLKEQERVRDAEIDRYRQLLEWNSRLQADQDRSAQAAINDEMAQYELRLKFNSRITEDQIKADEQAAKDEKRRLEQEQKQKNQDYLNRLEWNSKLQADQDKAASEEHRREQAQRERERRESIADYRRRLWFNSKIQEDKDNKDKREAEKAAKAADWSDKFVDSLGKIVVGGLLGGGIVGLGRAAIQKFEEQAQVTEGVRGTQERTGMPARDVRVMRLLAENLTSGLSEEEAQGMAEQAYGKMRDFSLGLPTGAAARGFQAFGFDRDKFMSGQQGVIDILANMSDAYKEYGNSAKFAVEAESIFGKNWTSLRPILASGRRVIMSDPTLSSVTPTDLMNPKALNTINAQRMAHGLPPISSMMGGGAPAQLSQSLSSVTSLQSMGGGDVLSAIARGPQERIASATEETAKNTSALANKFGASNYVGGFEPPAKLGR